MLVLGLEWLILKDNNECVLIVREPLTGSVNTERVSIRVLMPGGSTLGY